MSEPDDIIRNVNPHLGWVRVLDELPSDGVEVVVLTRSGKQWFAGLVDNEWIDRDGCSFYLDERVITHWRNPHPPPKEGE